MTQTALLFAGQGAQAVGMGRSLVERFPTAKDWFERANSILGYELAKICFEGPEEELTKTEYAQPAIFVVGWIAFQVLSESVPNLKFAATAGLSLGEFTALAAANALSFEDALKVVRFRGELMQKAAESTKGGMAAIIGLDEKTTREVCAESGVELANLNCPGQIVISGAADKLPAACEVARRKGAKKALPLAVAGAFHSSLIASAQPGLRALLESTSIVAPTVPVIANVTARPHGSPTEIRAKLVEQVTAPVRWEESMRFLLSQGFTRFIELGPGTALSGFMRRIEKDARMTNVADAESLAKTLADHQTQPG
jgi:[acyl-carrier-protein] S-malonyltransferase